MNEIVVKHGVKLAIEKSIKTTRPTVDKALFGVTKTPLALRIRKKALELGGVEVPTKK